jgi:23S rRNA pseudouridine2605 synthase
LKPLQKWLAAQGVGSKNHIRQLITNGHVTVDGVVIRRFAEPISPEHVVAIDDEELGPPAPRTILLMNKPKKHTTDWTSLGQYIPEETPRVFAVGRLDYNTEGALLWTNDGALARRVLHPEFELPKVYGVKIRGHLAEDDPGLDRIRAGMTVRGIHYRPAEAKITVYRTRATWVQLVLREGKHREIRRMCAACRYQIVKLRRLAIGPIDLGELNPRCVRPLSNEEIAALDVACGLS